MGRQGQDALGTNREVTMSGEAIETYQAGGLWHNHVQGSAQILSSHPTKDEAEQTGRKYANGLKVDHIIRTLTGRISQHSSYPSLSSRDG